MHHTTTAADRTRMRVLSFRVGDGVFGINTRSIREVVSHSAVTALQDVPRFVLGLTEIRGEALPVIDLAQLLGGEKATHAQVESCYVIAWFNRQGAERVPVCLLVDQIREVGELGAEGLGAPPQVAGRVPLPYVEGVAQFADEIRIVLDVDRLLAPYLGTAVQSAGVFEAAAARVGEAGSEATRRRVRTKYLSAWAGGVPYAFPLGDVVAIISKDSTYTEQGIPDGFRGACLFRDKPLVILPFAKENAPGTSPDAYVRDRAEESFLVVQSNQLSFGVPVERLGQVYEAYDDEIDPGRFCQAMSGRKLKSRGVLKTAHGEVEIIDPRSLLPDSEVPIVTAWYRAVERISVAHREGAGRSAAPAAEQANKESYLVVGAGRLRAGIRAEHVAEILGDMPLTRAPSDAGEFCGLLNLRREVYPVVDLTRRLEEHPANAVAARSCILIVNVDGSRFGVRVERIYDWCRLAAVDVSETGALPTVYVKPDCIAGVATDNVGPVMLLEMAALFGQQDISLRELIEEISLDTVLQ